MESKKPILRIWKSKKSILVVDKKEIESCVTSDIIAIFEDLEAGRVRKGICLKDLLGKFSLKISGYDGEEAIFRLDSFRSWADDLCSKYGGFPYFLDAESVNFIMLAVTRAEYGGKDIVRVNINEEKKFLDLYQKSAIDIGIRAGYSEEEMIEYFKTKGKRKGLSVTFKLVEGLSPEEAQEKLSKALAPFFDKIFEKVLKERQNLSSQKQE